ncbi:MAG: CocE/NonD family hydrolase [Gemmatimonadetes bacterium]|nr:CocE/NonD family hydrolase [Gemmatimonadota bacterium]
MTVRGFVIRSLVMLTAAWTPVAAQAAPDSGWWTTRPATPRPPATFGGVARRSVYVPMRDGVRLAVDVFLPAELPAGTKLPTLIEQTRYQRSFKWAADSLDRIRPDVAYFVTRGYAYLVVDVRGSGASFGKRRAEFDEPEVRDGWDLAEWVVAQAWSSGRIGALGVSYVGTTADLLLVNQHPAVKAIAPLYALFDAYADIVAPGGLELTFFVRDWGTIVAQMDRQEVPASRRPPGSLGVRPTDEDPDGTLLRAAVAEHRDNYRVDGLAGRMDSRDASGTNGLTIDATSTHTHWRRIAGSGAATYSVSGWWDGGYPYGSIKRFLTIKTPGSRLLLGPWSHGGRYYFTPRDRAARISSFDRNPDLLQFFDFHLKGVRNGADREPLVRYYTMGEERWKTARTWPPPGATRRTWYLAADGAMTPTAGAPGADPYQVDTTAGTGGRARWNTLLGGIGAQYPDRAEADRKLLTYDTPPLTRDVEVTGHPSATIWLTASTDDAGLLVYLEEVFPDGHVGYVTEGVVRARHRALRPGAAPYRQPTPYRSGRAADARPLEPGRPDSIWVDLLPVSHRFTAGSRVRVAIAGADRDHFAQVPAGQVPTLTILRGGARASRLVLPTMAVPTRGER